MPVRDILNAASSQGAGPSDPYFYDVSLLLNGDGTNGAQNNTFLDSSSNAFTITRNGNTTQGSFSPYGTLWSNYFNGSSSLRGGSSISTGTGDYTVECWANMPSPGSNSNGNIFITIGDEQTGTGCCFYQYNNSVRMYGAVLSGAPRMNVSYTFSPNVWYHIAFVRSGSTTTAYVNGTSIGTATVSATGNAFSGNPYVSEILDTGNFYKGDACYISNLRVTQSALYTSTFTPSTTPLTAISGVQFLTSQSNRFIDNSSNNVTLTTSGSPSVQRFSPFNPTAPYDTATIGGSGYFDGSGSYLSIANNTNLTVGTSFTIESWFYTTASSDGWLLGKWVSGGQEYALAVTSAQAIYFYFAPVSVGGTAIATSSGIFKLNCWNHVAVSRTGGVITLYVNGVSAGTVSNSTAGTNGNTPLYIGCYGTGGPSNYFPGYITDTRINTTTAVYTGNFTPPTAPEIVVSGTQLLLSYQNAGIPDLAMQNDLQTVGSAQVSTSVVKYGTGSLSFSAAGSYLNAAKTPVMYLGGDFTIEAWIYPTANAGSSNSEIVSYGASGQLDGWHFYQVASTNVLSFGLNYAGLIVSSSAALSLNTWTHVAVTRSGTTFKLWINGTNDGTATSSTTQSTNGSDLLYVGTGSYSQGADRSFVGYIDDLRITNGYARYTTTFTPPTAALPTY